MISDNSDREEIQLSVSKKIDNWKLSYTNKYDLNNNNAELIEEEILLDYVGEYMFQDCLSVKLSYKNKDGAPDRDIQPENSIFLTPSFEISFAAALAVPPVAIKSSTIKTLSLEVIECLCTWISSIPYSNLYFCLTIFPGSFPFFLIGIKGKPSL